MSGILLLAAGRSRLRKLIPSEAVDLARSFRSALRLQVVFAWLGTLRNRRSAIRLGSDYGGWTIPVGALNAASVCYCVGCGEDISFDLELIRWYQCAVHGFDPTPRSIEYVRKATAGIAGYRFFEVGIWSSDGTVRFFSPANPSHVSHSITNLSGGDNYMEIPTRRLSRVLQELGHTRLALLKLDIEGAENEVIRTLLEDRLIIDILLVEFDELGFPTPERVAGMKSSLQALFAYGYRLFNISGTNFTFVLDQDTAGLRPGGLA